MCERERARARDRASESARARIRSADVKGDTGGGGQSYFAGNKAGSDEVLKLACSILGMDAEQCRAVEVGARSFRQVRPCPCHWKDHRKEIE